MGRKFESNLSPEARDEYIAQIQNEPWLKEILSKLNKPRFQVDTSIAKELKEIAARSRVTFTAQGIPRLPVVRSKADLAVLQEENAITLAHRDRVAEVIVSYLAIEYGLDTLWDAAEAKLQGYQAYRALPNERARALFVSDVLQPIQALRQHVKQVLAMAQECREALTHTHFTIKQHAEMGLAILGLKSS